VAAESSVAAKVTIVPKPDKTKELIGKADRRSEVGDSD
jgi:hypothetical protein